MDVVDENRGKRLRGEAGDAMFLSDVGWILIETGQVALLVV